MMWDKALRVFLGAIGVWPTAAAPADGVSPAAALRSVYDAVAGGSTTADRVLGKAQVFEKSVTAAANAGTDTTLATITTQPCLIESIVIHADAGQTSDLTSCPVQGGTSKVITFISATDAIQANLASADEQVAWEGAVRLAANDTLVMVHNGTSTGALDLTVTIRFRACVDGGYLA